MQLMRQHATERDVAGKPLNQLDLTPITDTLSFQPHGRGRSELHANRQCGRCPNTGQGH